MRLVMSTRPTQGSGTLGQAGIRSVRRGTHAHVLCGLASTFHGRLTASAAYLDTRPNHQLTGLGDNVQMLYEPRWGHAVMSRDVGVERGHSAGHGVTTPAGTRPPVQPLRSERLRGLFGERHVYRLAQVHRSLQQVVRAVEVVVRPK